MANHINQVLIGGRVGGAPEYKEFENGKGVVKFAVASTRRWGKEENQEETTWVDCESWGPSQAFIRDYVTKGREVTVIGRLHKDKWTDKDGNNRSTFTVKVEDIFVHGPKPGAADDGDKPQPVAGTGVALTDENIASVSDLVSKGIPVDVAMKAVLGANK